MRKKPVSDIEFYLDTENFDSVIELSQTLSKKMLELKNDLDELKIELMSSWAGEGRNAFEKKYRLLSQQFGDLVDDLRSISEELLAMEEAYIQQDTDAAKAWEGVTKRY